MTKFRRAGGVSPLIAPWATTSFAARRNQGAYAPRSPHARNARPAFTLVEMLAVLAVLAIFLSFMGATLISVVRLHSIEASQLQHLTDQARLADQFRADVAQAVAMPDRWEKFQADKCCLILECGPGDFIVYQCKNEKVERRHFQADKTESQVLSTGVNEVEFDRGARRLIKLRLIATPGPAARRVQEIAAALGGERR